MKYQSKGQEFNSSIISPIKIANFHLHSAVPMVVITGLALCLGFIYLGDKSLWWYETISVGLARLEWSKLFYVMSHGEANMCLYYILLHFWIHLGTSEFVVRSLSVIFATLTVPVVFALGLRLFNKWVGLLAALLLSVNPFFIQFAQEARSYGLVLFLASLSSLVFVAAIRRPVKWLWVLYVITSVLTVYAHVFGIFVLVAQAVSILFLRRDLLPLRSLLISGTIIILFLLPLMTSILLYSTQNLDWMSRPGILDVGYVASKLAGGLLILVAFLIPVLITLYYAIKELTVHGKSPRTWYHALILFWLIVPIIITFIFSQIKPIFYYRYFTICSVPLILLVAIGISHITRRWVIAVCLVIVLGVSGFYLHSWYFEGQKHNWRGTTNHVLSNAEYGDAVIFFSPFGSTPFNYYLERTNITTEPPVSIVYFNPDQYATTPVLVVPEGYSAGGRLPPIDPALIDRLEGYDRVWLVLSHQDVQTDRNVQARMIQDLLSQKYVMSEETDFYGIRVLLFTQQ